MPVNPPREGTLSSMECHSVSVLEGVGGAERNGWRYWSTKGFRDLCSRRNGRTPLARWPLQGAWRMEQAWARGPATRQSRGRRGYEVLSPGVVDGVAEAGGRLAVEVDGVVPAS
jgi:hypothetical protein